VSQLKLIQDPIPNVSYAEDAFVMSALMFDAGAAIYESLYPIVRSQFTQPYPKNPNPQLTHVKKYILDTLMGRELTVPTLAQQPAFLQKLIIAPGSYVNHIGICDGVIPGKAVLGIWSNGTDEIIDKFGSMAKYQQVKNQLIL
jgi:hypothetical protein